MKTDLGRGGVGWGGVGWGGVGWGGVGWGGVGERWERSWCGMGLVGNGLGRGWGEVRRVQWACA